MPLDGEQFDPLEQTDKKFVLFQEWETMDTQAARIALKPSRPAWLENLQPVASNTLISVPGAAAPLTNIVGEQVVREFFASYSLPGSTTVIDYAIVFCVSGSAYQVNLNSGAQVKFATAGTFSGTSDITTWAASRILIADPVAGYCTWDGHVLVKPGGVSPRIVVTNGGSGYVIAPGVTIAGGSGGGATAHAVIVGGVVTQVILDNAGASYLPGDILNVSFSGGAAAATAIVWPQFSGFNPVSVAVYQGRVWLVGGQTLQWSGTNGFDDASALHAAGQQTVADADLVHFFTVIRALNGFLFLFGDNSVRQIGTIQVVSGATTFTLTTLTSDQGTTFLQSVTSYNRLVVFANRVGVWAIYGASVEKISDPMDGIFQNADFTQPLIACVVDLNNIRTLLVLIKYNDPLTSPRSVFMAFMNKKWFVISQGSKIVAVMSGPLGGSVQAFVSSGADVTQILASATTAVSWLIRTALTPHQHAFLNKRPIRIGTAHKSQNAVPVTLTSDSENFSLSQVYTIAFGVVWLNNSNGVVNWQNNTPAAVTFIGSGFLFQPVQAQASGIYLGLSLAGNSAGFQLNGFVIEYKEGPAMRSINHG